MLPYLLGLLPVAATCGWYVGRKSVADETPGRFSLKVRRDYFKGLNYLLNEQPDKAVDVFIKLLEVDSDTVETHLALGALFRRRGEVERAIRIHQNIVARPSLAMTQRLQALSELGQDYLRAGVLDRAERLFLEIIKFGTQNRSSYQFLLYIYKQEKDWQKAIEVAHKLRDLGEPIGCDIAQYHCEIAEQLIDKGKISEAQHHLKKTRSYDRACVRASMISARIDFENKNYKNAIFNYKKVIKQDPAYLSEILNNLIICYREMDAEKKMISYLQDCLQNYPDHIAPVLAISDYLSSLNNDEYAINFVVGQIKKSPSFQGVSYLVKNYIKVAMPNEQKKLNLVNQLLDQLLNDEPLYRCVQCGFSAKSLFWLCPSCHGWGVVKPIPGTLLEN